MADFPPPRPAGERKGLDIVNPDTGKAITVVASKPGQHSDMGPQRGPLPITNPQTGEAIVAPLTPEKKAAPAPVALDPYDSFLVLAGVRHPASGGLLCESCDSVIGACPVCPSQTSVLFVCHRVSIQEFLCPWDLVSFFPEPRRCHAIPIVDPKTMTTLPVEALQPTAHMDAEHTSEEDFDEAPDTEQSEVCSLAVLHGVQGTEKVQSFNSASGVHSSYKLPTIA